MRTESQSSTVISRMKELKHRFSFPSPSQTSLLGQTDRIRGKLTFSLGLSFFPARLCSSLSYLLPSSQFSRAPLSFGALMKHYRHVMPDLSSELGSFCNQACDSGGLNCKWARRHFVWFPLDSFGWTQEGFGSAADLHLLSMPFIRFLGWPFFFITTSPSNPVQPHV